MKIRRILVALMMTISLSAVAEFTTVELAYEINLENLTVPVTSSGSLIFKECDDCDAKVVRMTRNTRFVVNGETVDLKEFRKSVFQIRDRAAGSVIVMHHLESDTVTSVSVTL